MYEELDNLNRRINELNMYEEFEILNRRINELEAKVDELEEEVIYLKEMVNNLLVVMQQ